MDAAARSSYRVVALIGLSMIFTLFLLAIVVEVVLRSSGALLPVLGPGPAQTLRFALLGATAVLFFVIRALSRVPAAQHGAAAAGLPRLVTRSVLVFALCEVPAVFGFTTFMLTGSREEFYIFLFIALLFFSRFFPRYRDWQQHAASRRGA